MADGQLHFPKVSLTLSTTLAHEMLRNDIPGSVVDLGKLVAKKIDAFVRENKLGYYPALSYFSDTDAVEPFLLNAIDQVAEVVQRVSHLQLMEVLEPIFSSVSMKDIQNQVYSLPKIRLKDPLVIEKLNQHYCADTISFELQVSLIQRDSNTEFLEAKVKKMLMRWLTDVFNDVNITSVRVL